MSLGLLDGRVSAGCVFIKRFCNLVAIYFRHLNISGCFNIKRFFFFLVSIGGEIVSRSNSKSEVH